MYFINSVIFGYFFIALFGYLIIFWNKKRGGIFSYNSKLRYLFLTVITIGVILAFYARFVEPYYIRIVRQDIPVRNIHTPLVIGLIADPQVGMHKKAAWITKIVTKIKKIKPDILLIAGDLISNEFTEEDESVYLAPLQELVGELPIYYVLGNHEYGVLGVTYDAEGVGTPWKLAGNKSELLINRMEKLDIPLLRNALECLDIKAQAFCIFGTDDIWGNNADYENLSNWDKETTLILLSHNPDSILYWPKETKKPDLILAGHTHGGQVALPFIGPLANPGIKLGKDYLRGFNYWEEIPIYVTVGIGESLGPIRLMTPPEIVVITITP